MREFLASLLFFTTIPVKIKEFDSSLQKKSLRFFPLIGVIVGALSGATIYFLAGELNTLTATIISIIISMMVTGVIHEDGLSDVADGFGGGYTKERVIEIMKDSAIGVYGAVAIIMTLLLKISLLISMPVEKIILFSIVAHTLSRYTPLLLVATSNYVSSVQRSKSKNINSNIDTVTIIVTTLTALIPLYFVGIYCALAVLATLLISTSIFRAIALKKIGGYTGDVLGAVQQLNELVIYVVLALFI